MVNKRIGCAGILVADIFCGPIDGLPPEGQLVAVDAIPFKAGGCAANVAIGLKKQGISSEVAGCVGGDPSAAVVISSLESAGVGVSQIRREPELTTSKTVILLIEGEDRRYVHTFGANAAFSTDHMTDEWTDDLDVLYLGGLGVLPGISDDKLIELLARCRDRGTVTVVDVVLPDELENPGRFLDMLPLIDVFLPNDDEGRMLTCASGHDAVLDVFEAAGAHTVVMTLGSAGAVALEEGRRLRCGAYPGTVVDPSGAGDAFAAGIITAIAYGWRMDKALRYAGALGVSAVSAVGTTDGVMDSDAVHNFIDTHPLEIRHEG